MRYTTEGRLLGWLEHDGVAHRVRWVDSTIGGF